MTWAKFDDRYHDNRKVKKAWRMEPAAVGLHVMSITYSSMHATDGVVDLDWIEEKLPNARLRKRVVDVLVTTGLYDVMDGETFQVHDYLDYNPSRERAEMERAWDRKRKELHRDPELVGAVRSRDHDRCRYCGTLVNWKDRRGSAGATYDHVIPRGPNSLENIVVACRRCNQAKNNRTPDQARMPLLDPGQMGSSSDLAPSQVNGQKPSKDDLAYIPSRPGPSL